MKLDDVAKAIRALPPKKDLWVHPETYREIKNLFPPQQFDPNTSRSMGLTGLMGSFLGVNVHVSNLVPKGKMLELEPSQSMWLRNEFQPPPPPPATPFDAVESLVEVGEDQWEARNANGQLLMELTERGARELSEERGIPLFR